MGEERDPRRIVLGMMDSRPNAQNGQSAKVARKRRAAVELESASSRSSIGNQAALENFSKRNDKLVTMMQTGNDKLLAMMQTGNDKLVTMMLTCNDKLLSTMHANRQISAEVSQNKQNYSRVSNFVGVTNRLHVNSVSFDFVGIIGNRIVMFQCTWKNDWKHDFVSS